MRAHTCSCLCVRSTRYLALCFSFAFVMNCQLEPTTLNKFVGSRFAAIETETSSSKFRENESREWEATGRTTRSQRKLIFEKLFNALSMPANLAVKAKCRSCYTKSLTFHLLFAFLIFSRCSSEGNETFYSIYEARPKLLIESNYFPFFLFLEIFSFSLESFGSVFQRSY